MHNLNPSYETDLAPKISENWLDRMWESEFKLYGMPRAEAVALYNNWISDGNDRYNNWLPVDLVGGTLFLGMCPDAEQWTGNSSWIVPVQLSHQDYNTLGEFAQTVVFSALPRSWQNKPIRAGLSSTMPILKELLLKAPLTHEEAELFKAAVESGQTNEDQLDERINFALKRYRDGLRVLPPALIPKNAEDITSDPIKESVRKKYRVHTVKYTLDDRGSMGIVVSPDLPGSERFIRRDVHESFGRFDLAYCLPSCFLKRYERTEATEPEVPKNNQTFGNVRKVLAAEKQYDFVVSNQQELRNIRYDTPGIDGEKAFGAFLLAAHQAKASDIHLEVDGQSMVGIVRVRTDGAMREIARVSSENFSTIMGVIAARSHYKDDRDDFDSRSLDVLIDNCAYSLRLERTLQQNHRQSIPGTVVRLQPEQSELNKLTDLDLRDFQLATILKVIKSKQGLVVITGPTGSGKTTLLYAMIDYLNDESRKIITVEDPIERALGGYVQQIAVNEAKGITFDKAIRSILRQDPDVILLGEIRDEVTAHAAVKAAATGHLVFATMHVNEAAEVVRRFDMLGVKRDMFASSASLFHAQRLVRKLCPECRIKKQFDACSYYEEIKQCLGRDDEHLPKFVYEANMSGCSHCGMGHGFKGRLATMELIPFDAELRNDLMVGLSELQIREKANRKQYPSFLQMAYDSILRGETTFQEVEGHTTDADFRGISISSDNPLVHNYGKKEES